MAAWNSWRPCQGRLTTVSKAKTHCCAIICILVAVVIIPRWRTPRAEKELPAIPIRCRWPLPSCSWRSSCLIVPVPYCARVGNALTQVIFCCTLRGGFLHFPLKVIWKTLASRFICWFINVYDCVTTGRVVWDEFLRVENRLLCAAPSICELVCAKQRNSAVFMS